MRAPARIVDMKLALPPLVLLASIAWVFASCSSSGVGDLALILEGEPRVVDITARSARVAATSKFDIVCSVAYGPTKEYGRLATDSDMAAAGHQDHGPLLTGLLPDTEYHLALGGIGPDGTVYRSKDITFRTKLETPVTSLKPPGGNLALLSNGARVVGTSSNFGGGDSSDAWGGDWAIDGDPATQWSSGGDGNDGWIEIELPQRSQISGVGFWTRTMGASAQIYSFQVVSDNGDVTGPFELEDAVSVQYFDTDLGAKRLRFEVVESSGGNVGAVEIEVYGRPAPSAP